MGTGDYKLTRWRSNPAGRTGRLEWGNRASESKFQDDPSVTNEVKERKALCTRSEMDVIMECAHVSSEVWNVDFQD